MSKYAVAIDAVGPMCWFDRDVEGDPGRTRLIEHATKYRSKKAAHGATKELRLTYPNRRFSVYLIQS